MSCFPGTMQGPILSCPESVMKGDPGAGSGRGRGSGSGFCSLPTIKGERRARLCLGCAIMNLTNKLPDAQVGPFESCRYHDGGSTFSYRHHSSCYVCRCAPGKKVWTGRDSSISTLFLNPQQLPKGDRDRMKLLFLVPVNIYKKIYMYYRFSNI